MYDSFNNKIAHEYLKAIIETEKEKQLFYKHYKPNYQNIMIAIAEFRLDKIRNSTKISYAEFEKQFNENKGMAIEKFFLYPYHSSFEREIIEPIQQGKFTLKELYQFRNEFPLFNPILVGKKLSQLP